MSNPVDCFISFKNSIENYKLPERFTFPFYYEPHPLSLLAVEELHTYLENQTDWQHDFGLDDTSSMAVGKMFGVLVVQNKSNEIGYLTGFSGKLAGGSVVANFVPPVCDIPKKDSFCVTEHDAINRLNHEVSVLEQSSELEMLQKTLIDTKHDAEMQIAAHREKMIIGRKNRKLKRKTGEASLNKDDLTVLQIQMSRESVDDKNQLNTLKHYWDEEIGVINNKLNIILNDIKTLKEQRKTRSASLQKKLFSQYQFLNSKGEKKDLNDIFSEELEHIPPAGSGDCAAPKLLHYAFKMGFKPLAMAEFWWGAAPKSEIRQHKNFYPACQRKCKPILGHMLTGLALEENKLLTNPAIGKTLEIVYQDDSMAVVNKPAGMLSVPGKTIEDSVYFRMKHLFPDATGPLIVHRLDMSTSGLMVIALTKKANKQLQKQFINRSVKKRYVALIDGLLASDKGEISLPLRGDFNDRPRQLMCEQYGKIAHTRYEVIARENGCTKLYLYPKTGRTHQLRVHCAHYLGLNMPIIGDDLYGNKAERLHLHAQMLELIHPITHDVLHFEIEAEF